MSVESEAVVKEMEAADWSGLPAQLSPRYQAKVEYEPDPPEASDERDAVCPWSMVAGETETERVGLMVMVTVVVAVPPSESVAWTQKVASATRDAVVYESDAPDLRVPPLQASPEYQV